jgi:hypothetical protein
MFMRRATSSGLVYYRRPTSVLTQTFRSSAIFQEGRLNNLHEGETVNDFEKKLGGVAHAMVRVWIYRHELT